jgi:hypothetical protein
MRLFARKLPSVLFNVDWHRVTSYEYVANTTGTQYRVFDFDPHYLYMNEAGKPVGYFTRVRGIFRYAKKNALDVRSAL